MELPISIGKNSNNELVNADLSLLPHLFVSWNEPAQLGQFFQSAILSLSEKNILIHFALFVSSKNYMLLKPLLPNTPFKAVYISNENTEIKEGTKFMFLNTLVKEMKKRKKKMEGSNNKDHFFEPLIVLVEDLFELVITNRKNTGLNFLQLLIYGQELNIHFIAGSASVYRNLLNQLLEINPKTKSILIKHIPDLKKPFPHLLGCELIITPENFYFFKGMGKNDFLRLFSPETT